MFFSPSYAHIHPFYLINGSGFGYKIVETLDTVQAVETVENVKTEETVETVETKDLKKSATDNPITRRDASASKKRSALAR